MSHRALVAVAREGGRYDVYRSPDAGADDRLERLRPRDARLPPGLVDGRPIARGCSMDIVLADHLDPSVHEALLVVGTDGGVTPHVVLPFVLATADGLIEAERRGVALALGDGGRGSLRPAYVRGWYHGFGEALGEALDAGLVSTAEAFAWLDEGVRRLAGGERDLVTVP